MKKDLSQIHSFRCHLCRPETLAAKKSFQKLEVEVHLHADGNHLITLELEELETELGEIEEANFHQDYIDEFFSEQKKKIVEEDKIIREKISHEFKLGKNKLNDIFCSPLAEFEIKKDVDHFWLDLLRIETDQIDLALFGDWNGNGGDLVFTDQKKCIHIIFITS